MTDDDIAQLKNAAFACSADDMHPYACDGEDGGCIHCMRTITDRHDPERCWLCNNGPPEGEDAA